MHTSSMEKHAAVAKKRFRRAHATALGDDATRHRNHCYRAASLAAAQLPPDREMLERIAIAAAFHDLGIWTEHTFDYLEPSVSLARRYLAEHARLAWEAEVVSAIRQHHKLSACRGADGPLAEAFRRADWIDVTRGLFRFSVPRAFLLLLYVRWPDAGFHRLLVRLELRHLRQHPLNPLPVFRL
jgi:hypothetical protein